jgi:hypothetical protein
MLKKYSEHKLNKLGGTDPHTPEEAKIYKKVDLVTLPEDVKGTNCFNCRFVKNGFCENKQVLQKVTDRNCCALWDNKDAYRKWVNE